jgi:hypothetical protein
MLLFIVCASMFGTACEPARPNFCVSEKDKQMFQEYTEFVLLAEFREEIKNFEDYKKLPEKQILKYYRLVSRNNSEKKNRQEEKQNDRIYAENKQLPQDIKNIETIFMG